MFGEFLYLCGLNGVGKISLLCIIIGLSEFELGEVCYDNMFIVLLYFFLSVLIYLGYKVGLNGVLLVMDNL